MALAIWDMAAASTRICPTTRALFGVARRWVTFPDMYPPIGYMLTTTPGVGLRGGYGFFQEYCRGTTAPGINPVIYRAVGVKAYQKGTRSFALASTAGAAVGYSMVPVACLLKRLVLYYRAMDEYGEIPA